jgi:hypothetical protein
MQVTDEVSLGGWSRVRSYPAAMMMRWSERRQDYLDLDGRFTAMLRLVVFRRRDTFLDVGTNQYRKECTERRLDRKRRRGRRLRRWNLEQQQEDDSRDS